MIFFNSEAGFELTNEASVAAWIETVIRQEEKKQGEVNYIFCDDVFLHEMNVKYLKHNELTDIISFDYAMGALISGDIFISVERVRENALEFNARFEDELHRVIVHGVLHFCGYKDKTEVQKKQMRAKEDYYLSLRTFK